MKLIQKLSLLAVLAPCSLAFASNPAICIKPEMLHQAAVAGQIHNVYADWQNHELQTYRWYNVGKDTYTETMALLMDGKHHWADGGIGYQDDKGVLCDYFDKAANKFVDLQMAFKLPSQTLKK